MRNDLQSLLPLLTSPTTGALIALLVMAAVIDWRTLRIPNWLTVSGMAYGLSVSVLNTTTVLAGLLAGLYSLGGILLAFAIFAPLYAFRVMGAGDVKLIMVVGAFIGVPATFMAFLYVGVAGGAFALVYMLYQSVAMRLFVSSNPAMRLPLITKMPYGPAVCAGTIVYVVRQLG